MFVTVNKGTHNLSAVAGEDLTSGDVVIVKLGASGQLEAFKLASQGFAAAGFATVEPTDPANTLFPVPLSAFDGSVSPFKAAETLLTGRRVLVEQGVGTAKTDRVVAGTYQFNDPLTAHGDGTLEKALTGDVVIAYSRETKVVAAGDSLYIQFSANLTKTV